MERRKKIDDCVSFTDMLIMLSHHSDYENYFFKATLISCIPIYRHTYNTGTSFSSYPTDIYHCFKIVLTTNIDSL